MLSKVSRGYGLVIFASSILLVGQVYILKNLEAFQFDGLLPLSAVLISLLVALFLLPLVYVKNGLAQSLLAGIGLSALIGDQFFPAAILRLDGAENSIETPVLVLVANAFFFLVLPIFLFHYREKLRKTLGDLAVILLLLSCSLSIWNVAVCINSTPESSVAINLQESKRKTAEVGQPNVYLIWLDALQTDYLQHYIETDDQHNKFSGFHLFLNNSANYPYTLQSYTSFMSGTLFKGVDYQSWSQSSERLRRVFSDAGYRISSYAKAEFLSPLDDWSKSAEKIFSEHSATPHPYMADFISYWLVKLTPAIFANSTLTGANTAGGLLSSWANPGMKYSKATTVADGIEPLSGVFTLRDLIADEADREAQGELVIAQAVIPHGPYVIDENCEYAGKRDQDSQETYYQQAHCALGLVGDFLETLAAMDRLERSIVVIFGDHGSGWVGLKNQRINRNEPALNQSFTQWNRGQMISRAAAALMIKPALPDKNTGVVYSQLNSQLVDLLPTVLGLVPLDDASHGTFDGIDIFSEKLKGQQRSKPFYYFRPGLMMDPYQTEIYDIDYSELGLVDLNYRGKLFTSKDLEPLACNRPVFIGKETFLYTGNSLGSPEGWGRWTIGTRAAVNIKSNADQCRPKLIKLSMRPYINAKHQEQRVAVFLNNVFLAEVVATVSKPFQKIHELVLPPGAWIQKGSNELRFEIANPISPEELGLGADKRRLGFGLEELEVR